MMARILIVEDDNMIRERLVKALTFEGYDAVGAENGAVALRQIENGIPDLVIADVLMPDVGGFDFVSFDEAAGDIFDRGQTINVLAIDLEVHRLHAATTVHDDLHGDAFGIDHRLLSPRPRPRQGNDHGHKR